MDATALERRLRETAGQPPENPHLDNGPWDFVAREDAAWQEAVARPVLVKLAGDAAEVIRVRAVDALMLLPAKADTVDRLTALAKAGRFAGQAAERLQHALSNMATFVGREREVAAAIKRLAGNARPYPAVVIARYEVEFVIATAKRFAGASDDEQYWPGLAATVAFDQRDRLLELLAALRPLAVSAKEAVLQAVSEALKHEDAHVAAWAKHRGLPPPVAPKPTLEQCRAAIGL